MGADMYVEVDDEDVSVEYVTEEEEEAGKSKSSSRGGSKTDDGEK